MFPSSSSVSRARNTLDHYGFQTISYNPTETEYGEVHAFDAEAAIRLMLKAPGFR